MVQQVGQHRVHADGGLPDNGKVFQAFGLVVPLYQFRIAAYGCQRGTEFVDDGTDGFLAAGHQFLVVSVDMLQLRYHLFQPSFVLGFQSDVTMDYQVGYDKQDNCGGNQSSNDKR